MSNSSTKPLYAHRAQRTLQNLAEFARDVQESVKANLPTGAQRYGKVAVIGYTWSNDDMNCQEVEEEFFHVLRKEYNFHTESYVIDASARIPLLDLQKRLSRFREKHDDKDALLIFVYSGHSNRNMNNELELFGDTSGNAPIINWTLMSAVPTAVVGRCLLIFDSCYAATAGTLNNSGPELLAASGIDNQASASATYNFTSTLANHMRRVAGEPQTVGQIYSDLCRNALSNHLSVTPVHFLERGKASIVLERLPAASSAFGTATKKQRDEAVRQLGNSRYRVLIQVHLRGDVPQPDVEQWTKWLSTNLPNMVGKITLEAKYGSNSTILHVSMPIEVWDGLPADKSAYSFVAWVTGPCTPVKLSTTKTPSSNMPIREKKENLPPGQGR